MVSPWFQGAGFCPSTVLSQPWFFWWQLNRRAATEHLRRFRCPFWKNPRIDRVEASLQRRLVLHGAEDCAAGLGVYEGHSPVPRALGRAPNGASWTQSRLREEGVPWVETESPNGKGPSWEEFVWAKRVLCGADSETYRICCVRLMKHDESANRV